MMSVRYRWGCLSVSVSDGPTNNIRDTISGYEILRKNIGNKMDSSISWGEVMTHLNKVSIG
jgi:hypothetical protein